MLLFARPPLLCVFTNKSAVAFAVRFVACIGPSRTWLASAQLPRIGFVLFLDKKNQKSSQTKCFLCRTRPCAAKPVNHGPRRFCPHTQAYASAKPSNALAAALATIVLPSFARKLSSDGLLTRFTPFSGASMQRRTLSVGVLLTFWPLTHCACLNC
jgi:hypothetical protein